MPSRRERRRSGARTAAPTATRCRAVLSYGPRPHGSYGRHRGRHRHVVYELAIAQKVDFRPERRLRLRRRDDHKRSKSRSDAERHPHALPAHHTRSARPPLGIGGVRSHRWGRGSKRVEVHCKTVQRLFRTGPPPLSDPTHPDAPGSPRHWSSLLPSTQSPNRMAHHQTDYDALFTVQPFACRPSIIPGAKVSFRH